MKKLLIPAVGVIAAGLLGTPYYLGIKAEESLKAQQKLLQDTGFLTVESHRYERGWFSATETTVVRVKPTLLQNAQKYLPENLKTVLKEPITVVNHIKHGPFANGLTPVRAHVDTEIKYHPETAKVLARFFGNQTPVTISNTVHLNGSGDMSLNIPAFDYEELSGIKLSWKGFSGTTGYAADFNSYTHDYAAPALQVKLADKGDVLMENLRIQTETQTGKTGVALGKSSVTLDRAQLEWKEGIDYNFKLNELVNLVTNLQIGAFINPTGTIAPSKIVVNKLKFDTQTGEKDQWINSEGRFQFEKLAYGEENYGPLDINVAAEHLDAKSLLALKNKIAETATKEMTEEQIQAALIQTAKNEASGLFTNNPVLNVKTFKFTMPQGIVDVKGKLAFNGLAKTDLNTLEAMLKKTTADFDMRVPQKLLESLAVTQARSIFSVNPEDEAAGQANIEDINETLRLMVDSTVKSMAAEKYLTLDNGNIVTKIQLGANQLKLNGKVFENGPEPEIDESDLLSEEEINAIQASAAKPAAASAKK
ncbi:YdgA family protein [Neisseria sp.]|uniref:YdgA family protein n=1 Tax=Neisseria sp. TaxID=192066 RepID=UPI00359FEA0A